MDETAWNTGVTTAAELVETEHDHEEWMQERRSSALLAARRALVNSAFGGSADAMDLVNLASWVMTGQDPWPEPKQVEPEKAVWVHGQGVRKVQDHDLPEYDPSDEGDLRGPDYDPAEGDEGR